MNASTGPEISSPAVRQARTCSATTSTNSTGTPARAQYAPSVPPIAPAPQIRIGSDELIAAPAMTQEPRPSRAAERREAAPDRQFVAGLMFIASVSSSTRDLIVTLPFCMAQAEPTATIGRR